MKQLSRMKTRTLRPRPSNGSTEKTSTVPRSKYRSLSDRTHGPVVSLAAAVASAGAAAVVVSAAGGVGAAVGAGAAVAVAGEAVGAADPPPATEKAIGDVPTLAAETPTFHGEKLVIGKS